MSPTPFDQLVLQIVFHRRAVATTIDTVATYALLQGGGNVRIGQYHCRYSKPEFGKQLDDCMCVVFANRYHSSLNVSPMLFKVLTRRFTVHWLCFMHVTPYQYN
jgi:hypothetical protein